MIDSIKQDAENRMRKSIESLEAAFKKIRTGRANVSLLDGITVTYYGNETQLNQLANISVEDSRTLSISPWEKQLAPDIEKAIMKSDLGLNPASNGDIIRVPLPALTEETRKNYIKQAKIEAEHARVAVRNIRRDANNDTKALLKDKEINEDDERRGHEIIQKLTDQYIKNVDQLLELKETDLLEI